MPFLRSLVAVTALFGAVGAKVAPRYSQVVGPYQPAYISGTVNSTFGSPLVVSPNGKEVLAGATGYQTGVVSALLFNGKSLVDKQRLLPLDYNTTEFGTSIALGGRYLAVGDPNGGAVVDDGVVHIYRKSHNWWVMMQTLTLATGGSNFGKSIAMSKNGKILVVGAINAGENSEGAVYVYRLKGTGASAQYNLIQGPFFGVEADSSFGFVLALSNDGRLLAVAGQDSDSDTQVWLYTLTNAHLFVRMPTPTLQGGVDLNDLNALRMAFSSKGDLGVCTDTPSSEGQLLIATRGDGAYTVAQTLVPTTTADYTPSLFCSSLGFSANGKSLAVGETGYGMGEGAVWMLQKTGRSGWAFAGSPITQRAPANNYAALGSSVAITKSYVLAGAAGYPTGASEGALFAFKK